MEIYITNLMIVTIIAILTRKKKLNKWVSIILVTIPLVCVEGFRYGVGTDFGNYYGMFKQMPAYKFIDIFDLTTMKLGNTERGFTFLIWLIGKINSNPQFIVFITSLINILFVVYTLKKYSESYTFSIYLYITTMIYYSPFNALRQWIASVFLFWAIKYIIEGKWKKYLFCVLLASTIHISATIMLPMYWMTRAKPFAKKTIFIIVAFILLSIFLGPFLGQFEEITEGTRYSAYSSISENDNGVNILRIAVAAVPVIISFIFYKRFKEDKEANILINYSILNLLTLALSRRVTLIARFCMYFELYNLLLYPKFLKLFKRDEKYIFIFAVAVCFFIYMCLLLPVDANLLPYRVFWQQ